MKSFTTAALFGAISLALTTSAYARQSEGDTTAAVALGLILLGIFIAVYFLPFIIGAKRGINACVVLFFINLFFGWTLLGWFVCLIWAATGATKAQDAFYRNANSTSYDEAYARERARLDHQASR